MGHWDDLRRQARARRVAVLAEAGGDPSAVALLAAADRLTGYGRVGVPGGDPLLDGGQAVLDPDMEVIWFNRDVAPGLALFYQAHEYAHFWLHHEHTACRAADLDPEAVEEPVQLGVQRVEGYGPEERREREANVFAREFLLPADLLRAWYAAEGLDATAIAARVGLPEGMVLRQLATALLTPELAEEGAAPGEAAPERPLDRSQVAAAHAPRGPLLLEAGPGTGKTATLIGRVVFLLQQGAPPSAILALTFSNRAAEEMRARVARTEPEAAPRIWMGTFHAFGLELLRKYGARLGLPPRPDVLDPADAVALLERALPELGLDHYQNLYEPTTYLRDILSAISRAKDELVGPDEYAALAERMRADATDATQVEAAEKALEVARVYARYQALLDREHRLDFGDLIAKAVRLLRAHPDVRDEVRRSYRHVLVDEYQDVNRASGLLLRELAGAGAGLWVVGDARQAIYRFRGAAPANMRLFPQDFPGASVKVLGRNYRSQPMIVDVFAGLAPAMRAARGGVPFTPWQPHRPDDGGRVLMEIADDLAAEGDGLAREIERQRAAGIPYREQAVLCRSHSYLGKIAAQLERAGVPMLYLGDLFERPEVRDLLAVLALACEGDGHGLMRVARFPEYQIPLADVRALLTLARERDVPFPRALDLARDADGISPGGQERLALLARHLDGLCYGSHAWPMLARYLFVRSTYLRPVLGDESVAGQQRRLALYQFLQFAHEQRSAAPPGAWVDPKRFFLQYVRRLEIFGEERQLRQVPGWADGIDAVRLLTVHASKGLEFRAVYLPALGQGIFPARRQGRPCPPPVGMLAAAGDDHDEEEECLFFVALSRARDVLCLARAQRYGNQNSNPSSLLLSIAGLLPTRPGGPATWPSAATAPPPAADPPPAVLPFHVEALDVYIGCPRQFFYEFVLGLSGKREDSAYVQFHGCVYRVLRWMADERADGQPVDAAAALARLAEAWAEHGPRDHPYEALYRRSAEAMVLRAAGRPIRSRGPAARPEWEVRLPHGRVRFTPDHVEALEDGSEVVERLRTGRPSQSELAKDIYALYQVAAREARPRAPRRVQVRYLSSDHVEQVDLSRRTIETRLGRYDAAIAGILREEFPAQPNDRVCPRCPHYFICPLAEDA
ncbi:MAG: UvrD-helicase domain-containing protein [Chloroflexi bacterium]|nr:UvrD-helicase domain-containing protein [Chloroflexota bacterium]